MSHSVWIHQPGDTAKARQKARLPPPRSTLHPAGATIFTMNKSLLPILAIVALGAGGFAFVQMQSASEARAQLERINAEQAAKEHSLQSALDELRKKEAELAAMQANNERLKKERDDAKTKAKEVADALEKAKANPGAAGDNAAPKTGFDLRGIAQNLLKGLDDPEQRKAFRGMQQQQITTAYDKLFQKLGLNEQDAKLVSELLADRNMSAMDKGRKLLTGTATEEAMTEARKEIQATKTEYDGKLKSVLGEQKFTELAAYEQTVGDQRTLDSIERQFTRKNQPMAAEQKDGLANIMREERLKNPSNDIPDLGGGPGMSMLMGAADAKAHDEADRDYNRRVVARAGQAGLSPDQVINLQDSLEQSINRRVMGRAFGRAFIGGAGK